MGNVIEIENLTKSYGTFPVFYDLSLSIKEHTATAILGPNGCGKTTLLKTILGVTKVNFGNISIFDKIVLSKGQFNKDNLSYARRKIGFIPDKIMFYEHLTAFEYLQLIDVLAQSNQSVNEESRTDFINSLLKEFRLDRWSNRIINTFSTGTRQKLALVASLVHKPELMIMDEPFRGIDPEAKFKFLKYLNEYRDTGLETFGIQKPGSIVICSHNLVDIQKLCNYVHVMNEYGEIVISGSMAEVTDKLQGKKFEELLFRILNDEDIIDQRLEDELEKMEEDFQND